MEQITENIKNRLTDEDVKQNPIFKELLEECREARPKEMSERVEVNLLKVYYRFR